MGKELLVRKMAGRVLYKYMFGIKHFQVKKTMVSRSNTSQSTSSILYCMFMTTYSLIYMGSLMNQPRKVPSGTRGGYREFCNH